MFRRLLLLLTLAAIQPIHAAELQLTEAEREWLTAHPELRLGIDPEWPPFEFYDEGGLYSGMGADFIALISQRLGVSMKPVPGLSWSEVLQAAHARQVDILPAAMATTQRERYLSFTHPYLDFPMVIITRADARFVGSLEELRGRRVAVVRGYVSHDLMLSNHSDLRLVPSETINEALNELATGGVDAFVGNLASVSRAINELGLGNLKVAAHTPYSFKLGMGVRKDWPELVSILQKALDSIDEEEALRIRQKWVQLQGDEGVDIAAIVLYIGPFIGAVLIVLLVTVGSNKRLRREIEERRQTEAQLRQSEEALRHSQAITHIGNFVWEIEENLTHWSEELYRIVDRSPDEFIPSYEGYLGCIHPEDREHFRGLTSSVLEQREPYSGEYRIVRPDGSVRHIFEKGQLYRDEAGKALRLVGVIHDITETKLRDLELEAQSNTLQSILDNAPIGIWYQNADGRLLFVNQAFCSAVGISEETFLSVPHYAELYPPEIAASCMRTDAEAMAEDGAHTSFEKIPFSDGKVHDLEIIKARQVNEQGNISGLIGLSMDVTEKLQAEERLRQQAFYDELTGLANRSYLLDQLDKELAAARRHDHYSALLFFDLDNFKIINDTLGHSTGDRLLQETSTRLKQLTRVEDTIARLGGDEFVIIASALSSDEEAAAQQARQLAEKLRESLSLPYMLEGHEHHLTLSIGINLFPVGEQSIDDLLKQADTAMYRAKESGRDAISFFQPSMQQATEERFRLQADMRQALALGEFELHYQPQLNEDGRVLGAETLLRWKHPERGFVSPANFIPLAEESGLILDIGDWVLREACAQMRRWRDQGLELDTLAINVSPRQFQQKGFVKRVEQIMADSGVDPAHLELELTEGIFVNNIDEVSSKMERLRALGLRFSIDDFGTGYSSLAYLKRLPLDRLKIDQSFVRDITRDDTSALNVEAILALARHLTLEVIAEGVEEEAERRFLLEKGCDNYQGYLFSRPLALEPFTHFIQNH